MVEQVKGSKPWRDAVARAAAAHARVQGWATVTGPVEVRVEFVFVRPKSAPGRVFPITRSSGDIDKLCRNVNDALVDAGVIADDSQIVSLVATKLHAAEASARITVAEMGSPRPNG